MAEDQDTSLSSDDEESAGGGSPFGRFNSVSVLAVPLVALAVAIPVIISSGGGDKSGGSNTVYRRATVPSGDVAPTDTTTTPTTPAVDDTDNDGLRGAQDQCPEQAPVNDQNTNGCEDLDNDRDGVLEDGNPAADQCPTYPGPAELNGCVSGE